MKPPTQSDDLRKRAEVIEQRHALQFQDDFAALSAEETRQMLYELRVHQIELEMQNEELRRAQDELDAVKERYFNLYDLAPAGYCTISTKGIMTEANLTAAAMLRVERGMLVRQPFTRFIVPDDQDIYYRFRKQLLEWEEPQQCELRMLRLDGTVIWAGLKATIAHGQDGALECRLVFTDITPLKQTEEQLSAAIMEKEVLLREVHHRVKNNLAAICSLLAMQQRLLSDAPSRNMLSELGDRIRSMSLIHEKLYHADTLARIDFQDYIKALVTHLRTSLNTPGIHIQTDAQGIEMPLDLAVPCGMIINELVTNAMKYAFPQGEPAPGQDDCRILVRFTLKGGVYTLCVADNGVGLPPGFDLTEASTMGLVLVRMLGCHQLGGAYALDQEGGLKMTLRFSEKRGS